MKKTFLKLEEKEYRKRLRDSKRVEKAKPLIQKLNHIFMNVGQDHKGRRKAKKIN